MRRLTILLLSTIWLSGCGIKTVYVPVSSCPQPPVITMPVLAVNQLPQKPETDAALTAFRVDHITLRETLRQCITALGGYIFPPTSNSSQQKGHRNE